MSRLLLSVYSQAETNEERTTKPTTAATVRDASCDVMCVRRVDVITEYTDRIGRLAGRHVLLLVASTCHCCRNSEQTVGFTQCFK